MIYSFNKIHNVDILDDAKKVVILDEVAGQQLSSKRVAKLNRLQTESHAL